MVLTLTEVKKILRAERLELRKSLGQHFLVDQNFLRFIVKTAGVAPHDQIIEVGSGIGSLCEHLLERARNVWSFELDTKLYQICQQRLGGRANLHLFNLDGREATKICPHDTSYKFISNLPYSSYFEILVHFLTSELSVREYYVMVQKEVAEKMEARPGERAYGLLSVALQSLATVEKLRPVSRDLFYPRPKVESAFVKITPRTQPLIDKKELSKLLPIMRFLFSWRGKKAKAVLKNSKIGLSTLDKIANNPPHRFWRKECNSLIHRRL